MKTRILLLLFIYLTKIPFAHADQADDWFSRTFGRDTAEPTRNIPQIFDPEDYRYINTVNPDAPWHKAKNVIVAGAGSDVRGLQPYSWTSETVKRYADVANLYAQTFPDVRVYCMPVPLSSEFYSPKGAAPPHSRSQYEGIRRMFSFLSPEVEGVNIVPILGEHASEPIYSRTDHHWAPLGAYYAAQQLAAHAGLPFPELESYTPHTVPDYVGTMYMFSGDPAVKNAPETFVYYTPNGVDYNTEYITFITSGQKITGEKKPETGKFFQQFKGASAYCTFMGGDSKITKVRTSTENGRKLLILKDSFGNAIPGYLFGTFQEIHVVDCRYFNRNMKEYVNGNGITDIVFANNLGHASSRKICTAYKDFLTQEQ